MDFHENDQKLTLSWNFSKIGLSPPRGTQNAYGIYNVFVCFCAGAPRNCKNHDFHGKWLIFTHFHQFSPIFMDFHENDQFYSPRCPFALDLAFVFIRVGSESPQKCKKWFFMKNYQISPIPTKIWWNSIKFAVFAPLRAWAPNTYETKAKLSAKWSPGM